MSISSCPRCSQQITLPIGISNSAKVRCPICRAQYSLADALVNMPPLLEVVADESESEPSWFDEQDKPAEMPASESVAATEGLVEFEPAAPVDHQSVSDDDLLFEATEEHDDQVVEQPDTVIEELGISPGEPVTGRIAPADVPAEHALDENVLDFGAPVEIDQEISGEPASRETQEPEFGFEPLPASSGDDGPSLEFGEPLSTETKDGFDLEFEEAPHAQNTEGVLDFGEPVEQAGAADDIGLDFGEPVGELSGVAEPGEEGDALEFEPVAAEFQPLEDQPAADLAEPSGKKNKKEKTKKEKKERKTKEPAADGESPRKRSLVATLATVGLSSVLGLVLALYGALWIGKDYDFFNLGSKLPSFMVPAAYGKKMVAVAPPQQQRLPEPAAAENAAPPPAEEPPGAAAEQATPPAAAAANEPADSAPAPAADSQPVTPEPAAEAPAESAPARVASAASEPSAEKPDASLESLLADDKKAPEEMPLDQAEPIEPGKSIGTAPGATPPAAHSTPLAADDAPALPSRSGLAANVGPMTSREVSPAELSQELAKVSAANERMTAALAADDKNELKKVRANFYLSFYGLADNLALAKDDPLSGGLDPARKDAERLAMSLAGDRNRLSELKSYGAKWLAFGKRTTPGVVLAGKVQSAEQVGKLHQIRLQVTADTPQVTILSQADPGVESGDEVLALGSIVENPSVELAGYDGADAQIVWSGLTLKLPAQ